MAELFFAANKQISSAMVGKLHLTVLGRGEWSDDDWRAFCRFGVDTNRADGWAEGSLTFSSGHGPSAAQRRISIETVPKEALAAQRRIALLSDSALMRISMTAFSLLTRGTLEMKAFSAVKHDQAFQWLAEHVRFDAQSALSMLRMLLKDAGFDPRVLDSDWKSKLGAGK